LSGVTVDGQPLQIDVNDVKHLCPFRFLPPWSEENQTCSWLFASGGMTQRVPDNPECLLAEPEVLQQFQAEASEFLREAGGNSSSCPDSMVAQWCDHTERKLCAYLIQLAGSHKWSLHGTVRLTGIVPPCKRSTLDCRMAMQNLVNSHPNLRCEYQSFRDRNGGGCSRWTYWKEDDGNVEGSGATEEDPSSSSSCPPTKKPKM